MRKYVITGGPGVGKSTVIKLLSDKGYKTISEIARKVIESNLKKNSDALPWKDWLGFQREVCAKQLSIEEKLPKNKVVFLDRGYLDGLAYLKLHGGKPFDELLSIRPDYAKVFILEPLGDFKTDNCRKEDKKTALRIHELIKEAYAGYELVTIPAVSPEERVLMILNCINAKQ
jgi:predicted ATPase